MRRAIAPTSVFQLGRMRHLDLLAMWHQLHPDSHEHWKLKIARLSKDNLAALTTPPGDTMTTIAARTPGTAGPARNDVPVRDYENGGGYHYHARRPAWMAAAIAAAEREHGPPVPTCVCGHRLVTPRHRMYARCPECGRSAYTGTT
jgi:hypothetical protein